MPNITNLLYVPILHTQKEAGDIIVSLREKKGAQGPLGSSTAKQEKSIREMWDGIYEKIKETHIDYPSVRIYQDSLPVSGMEVVIVKKLAEKGSRNHQLILDLMRKNAKLEGTEDSNLLVKEYDNLRQLLEKASTSLESYRKALTEYKEKSTELMRERDAFIAERIKNTVMVGEIPLVFMGVRHQLEKLLQQDFVINYIIYRLPFKKVGDIYNV